MKATMTIKEAAGEFRISELGVWMLIRQGRVKTRVFGTYGRQILVGRGELARYFEANPDHLRKLQEYPQ